MGTQIVIYVLLAFNLISLILTTHLITFHIWLSFKGITTFEHIIYKREKREKELELKVCAKFILTNIFWFHISINIDWLNINRGVQGLANSIFSKEDKEKI